MSKPGWVKPIDSLCIVFLAALLGLTLLFHDSIPGAASLAARYLAVMVIVPAASYARFKRPGNTLMEYMDVLMPMFVVLFTFDSLGRMTQFVNPPDKDRWLAGLDLALFGVQPGVWMERLILPELTTALQLCYTSYYFLPAALCLIMYFQGRRGPFERSVYGIVLGFFVSYIGYIAVPALGPRVFLHDAFHADLLRGPLATAINDTLNLLEGENRDAFPSGHTEVVLIALCYAWAYMRWYFWLSLPLVVGLIFSTVYLRYHYAVDVLAGAALAPVSVWAASWLYELSREA